MVFVKSEICNNRVTLVKLEESTRHVALEYLLLHCTALAELKMIVEENTKIWKCKLTSRG